MYSSHQLVLSFAEDLAVLLKSGSDLDSAFEVIVSANTQGDFKAVLIDLHTSVRSGSSLNQAMSEHSSWFGPYIIGMVKSGEASAHLAPALERLAEQLERDQDLKTQISNALIYPAILIVAMCLSLVIVLGVILPRLTGLFGSLSGELSPAASLLFGLGNFVTNWGAWMFGGFLMLVLAAWVFRKTLSLKSRLIALIKKVPTIRLLLNQIEFARFTSTMSSLLDSGMQQTDALEIASQSFSQDHSRKQASMVVDRVKDGHALSTSLAELDGYSDLYQQSIASGERGGELAYALGVLASRLQKDFSKRAQRLAIMLEPILILVLGLVIGFVVYAVFSAMQSIADLPI